MVFDQKIFKKRKLWVAEIASYLIKKWTFVKKNFRFETYDSLRYKNIPLWYFYDKYYRDYGSFKNVQNITFYGVICRFRQVCLNMIGIVCNVCIYLYQSVFVNHNQTKSKLMPISYFRWSYATCVYVFAIKVKIKY